MYLGCLAHSEELLNINHCEELLDINHCIVDILYQVMFRRFVLVKYLRHGLRVAFFLKSG